VAPAASRARRESRGGAQRGHRPDPGSGWADRSAGRRGQSRRVDYNGVGGALVLVPIYLAVLVLLKGMQSVVGLVRPISALLPDWVPGENFWALLIVLIVCFAVGTAVRTRAGREARERVERSFFGRVPGYALFRSLTQRMAGEGKENVWKPVLVELEDALVPAFIVEELGDDRLTVFVPSIPTPFAGAVYILSRERVHLVDIPFTQAIKSISRWGSGSGEMVAAMRKGTRP
jgi:uncharacterized membrane protein